MLQIKNLTKIYKAKGGADTKALDDVTVSFPETGMIFLLGKSGSGKSTLLNVAGGLDYPTSGEIVLKGRSSKNFSQSDFDSYRNTYIGFIFQEYNVLNEFNIEQNIALALELQGKKATKEAVENLLKQVDLEGFGKRKPNTLSGGQKQRIAIARALIKEPNIIMADEPTGALDSKTGEQVFETLKKLSADKLVVVVSHDRDFAERFGDRIIELKDGKIISDQSKHQIEAKPISENVTIINDKAIRINDAKKLTKAEFDKLYDTIKGSDGQVFISSGENATKSMKVARISADGKSDEFKRTESVKLRVYDGSQTKFIRSKMPAGKSIKMGLSSLKTKPVRLIFTILLSVISFTLFGVASSLMLYNSSHTYSEALRKTDYLSEKIQKRALGKYVNQELDSAGNLVRENKYDSSQDVLYGKQEIKQLNENNLGLVYIPISEFDSTPSFNVTMEKDTDFYRTYYRINYISDATQAEFSKLGYKLDGAYPVNDDEILLPKIFGEMLIDSKAYNKPSYTNLIGETIQVSFSKGYKTMKMVGFFDAGDIPEKYLEIKKGQESNLTEPEMRELRETLPDFFSGSFNSVVFANSNVFDQYARRSGSYDYVQTYQRAGLLISDYDIREQEITTDYWFDGYTEEIIRENAASFEIYDMDDNPVDAKTISMSENDIYIAKDQFDNYAYSLRNGLLEGFLRIDAGDYNENYMRFMPTYYDYYVEHVHEVEEIRNSLWYDREPALDLFNQYKNEFKMAYQIVEYMDEFKNSSYFWSILTHNERTTFQTAIEGSVGSNTVKKVNDAYELMINHFDSACPYYLPYRFIRRLVDNGTPSVRNRAEYDLHDQLLKDYKDWTADDANLVKEFLRNNYSTGFDYRVWNNVLDIKGNPNFLFSAFNPVPDEIFSADKNLKYYYKDYLKEGGMLNVKGYFECASYSSVYILKKSFIDNHSTVRPNDGHQWRSFFETEYEAPEDARYLNVMVKTDYTQDQVSYMLKNNDPHCKYDLTSNKYNTVNFVVEMINMLKTIFFWTGVGFGVFAALMLLNFITVSVAGKKKDIGILRAIGARKSDVFKIFFVESLFIAALCSLISIIGAFVAQFFMDRSFVQQIGISILQFSPITVGLIIAIALVISFVATIIPVISASRKPPVESIRAL